MNLPWTHEELRVMRARLDERMREMEQIEPDIRPLPPLTEHECLEHLFALGFLLGKESFIFGQLLAQYRQSVEARMLGKKGRYFVLSEDDIRKLTA